MARVYVYVMSYDFGFAPNPFGGVCTLACCVPVVRRKAEVSDWVVGLGGRALKATGRCLYAMQVTGAMTFGEYWESSEFRAKRPRRNGSRVSMVGDNIYHRRSGDGAWVQEDSIHSRPDGSQDDANTAHDTGTDRMLVSERFVYFGEQAPVVPPTILQALGYRNGRGHRVFPLERAAGLIAWVEGLAGGVSNRVLGDPFQLGLSARRYSKERNRIV